MRVSLHFDQKYKFTSKSNGLGVPKNFGLWEGGKIEFFYEETYLYMHNNCATQTGFSRKDRKALLDLRATKAFPLVTSFFRISQSDRETRDRKRLFEAAS